MESDDLNIIPIMVLENYRITRKGQIWSCYSKKFLKTRLSNGYYGFTITKEKKVYNYYIHRLLAIVFIPNSIDERNIVNHKNGNKTDNDITNLEWVTQKENINKCEKQTSHPRELNQIKNGKVINTFSSVTEASLFIGLSRSSISKACLKVNKTAGGFEWEYKDPSNNHEIINLKGSKRIYDYDNYFVFKDGQIFNKDRKKYLKPIQNDSGYCYVTLCKNRNKKNYYIHILVVDHFFKIKRKKNKLEVNHINKKRNDNTISNLELVSHSDNMIHAYKNTLIPS